MPKNETASPELVAEITRQVTEKLKTENQNSVDTEALKAQLRAEIKAEEKAERERSDRMAEEERKKALEKAESDKVDLYIFRGEGKYREDVVVTVNGGKTRIIKRGHHVMVPRYVAEVVMNSMRQDEATENMIETEEGNYQDLVNREIL